MLNRHLKTLLGMSFALASMGISIGCGSDNKVQLPPKTTPQPKPSPKPPVPPDSDNAQDDIDACLGFTGCIKLITDSAIEKAMEFSAPKDEEKPPKEFMAGSIKLKVFDEKNGIVELIYENLEEQPAEGVKVTLHGEVKVTLPKNENNVDFAIDANGLKVTIAQDKDSVVWDAKLNIKKALTIVNEKPTSAKQTGSAEFKSKEAKFTMNTQSPLMIDIKLEGKEGEEEMTETIQSGQLNWNANKKPITIVYEKGKIKVNGKELPEMR